MSSSQQHAGILGIGSYAPERILTNDDLTKIVDTSDEWIVSRTGIKERRIARDDEYTSDIATQAALRAIEDAGLTPEDIDYVLLGTASPDNPFPNTAAWVCKNLGLMDTPALDVSTACSGFLFCLELATGLVESGRYKNVLAIGAEKLSSIVDYTDRTTCVLFGDGSGAALVGMGGHRIHQTRCATDFNYDALYIEAGSRCPVTKDSKGNGSHLIRMNGREVYRFVVSKAVTLMEECFERAGISAEDIDLFVPHQANLNMLEFLVKRLEIPAEKMMVNIQKFGNTSSASVPIALDQAYREGRLKKGDKVLLLAFGGGLSSGYALVEW